MHKFDLLTRKWGKPFWVAYSKSNTMGIAKSIEAFTIYEDYNSDIQVFIRRLSDRLNADFSIEMYDFAFHPIENENRMTTFNKKNKYSLTITFNEYDIEHKIVHLPTYEITIPINYIYENSIELAFYPNNSVHITYLTFEHLWSSFIDELKFQGFGERMHLLKRYQSLREEYAKILLQLGIKQIYLTTHAFYEIENIIDMERYHKLTFEDIAKIAQQKDNLTIFNFQQILNATKANELNKQFIHTSNLEILLLDTLNSQ